MSPALISQDGRWWWDGMRWRTRLVEGPLDLFWFTTTPDWAGRVLVTGLIGLIPIVGAINMLGWVLACTDMMRQRWKELPPADFRYISRGASPFFVTFLYGLVVLVVIVTLLIIGFVLLASKGGNVAIGLAVLLLAFLLWFAWWLITLYFTAAVLIASDKLGFARAIDPRVLIRLARQNHDVSLHVGVTLGIASIAFSAAALIVGVLIPFGGIAVSIALPAVYLFVVPKLAEFKIDG